MADRELVSWRGGGGSGSSSLLVFRVGSTLLGADALAVEQVANLVDPTPVPRTPDHVRGLVQLRGEAVPLLDLGRFLGLEGEGGEGSDEEVRARIVVVACGDLKVGIPCARVRGMMEVDRQAMAPPDALAGRLKELCRAQIDDAQGLIAVLDLEALLSAAAVRKRSAAL